MKNFEQSERCFSALEPVRRIALGTARGVVVEAAGAAGVPSTMGDDPFYVNMTHASNRQYNRQNPSFDSRPPDFGHLASNAKWPEAQRWHSAGPSKRRSRAAPGGGIENVDAFTAPFDMSLSPHLLLAALEDDAAVVKDLVSRGAWTECRADSGATPLICAAAKGSIASVEALLEAGANVVATDDVGANAVTLAAFHGRGDVIDFILDSTEVAETDGAALALLTWPTRKGETPLMAAARGGRADVVRLLARRMAPHAPPGGLDGDGGGYWDGGSDARERTAAALAARGGQTECLRALIELGCDANERSGVRSMTPLMHAACKGRVACVNYLLGNEKGSEQGDEGAAASSPDDGGGVSDLLVKVRISPEGVVTIRPNEPPLQRAVSFEDGVGGAAGSETSKRPKPTLADPTLADDQGMTALAHAAASGHLACYKALAAAWPGGAPAAREARDARGRTPLMLAARFGGSSVVEHLLSVSGPYALKDVDANHETALFLAVKGGHVEPGGIAESILAKYGFHEHEMEVLEIKNAEQMTPLLWAAAHGRTETCRWLVAKGADILATDGKGRLPRQTADAHGHGETSEVLSRLARSAFDVKF